MRWSLSALTLCLAALLLTPASALALGSTFQYTGAEQTFEVPTGVYQIQFVAIGGHGGEANGPAGGEAAEVKGALDVEAGRTYYIEVGGNGQSNAEGGEGGFNGGAGGGGGGGGATDIRTESNVVSLATEDTRLVVAGGGGGGGSTGSETGGTGGAAGEPGGASSYEGGGAGTQTEGGFGASGCEPVGTGGNGELGIGGSGGYSFAETGPGGGGGGGYYGGGGGGGACFIGSSGGGGGSSLVPPLALQTLTTAQPKIEIKYNPPPSVAITNPVDEAVYTRDQVVHVGYSCTPGSGAMLKTCAGEDWMGPVADGEALDTSEVGEFTFGVFAEDMDKGQSGKSIVYKVVEKKEEEPAPPGPTPPGPTPTAAVPDTTLGSHPKKTVKTSKNRAKVKFSFSSDAPGATFKCKLDKGAVRPLHVAEDLQGQAGQAHLLGRGRRAPPERTPARRRTASRSRRRNRSQGRRQRRRNPLAIIPRLLALVRAAILVAPGRFWVMEPNFHQLPPKRGRK